MEEDNSKRLPVTTGVTVVAAPTEVSAAVELVSEWALLTACGTVFIPALIGLVLIYFHVHCSPSSVVLRCLKSMPSTDAAESDKRAVVWGGVVCCAVLQTAVALLARLLPSRRRRIRIRHGLAFAALVVTIVGHCLYAAGVRLRLAADPGYLFYRISSTFTIFVLAVGDVFVFIAFLVAPGGVD